MEGSTRNCSLKRTSKVNSNNHHQLKDDEVKLRKSKKRKMTKTFGFYFLTYLLEN
jgi:hypothetical protein